jgi:hypothetical protein
MTWTWRQTKQLIAGSRGAPATHARPLPPSAANPDGRPTRPDKLSIWPVEDERFGVDVLYVGVQGFRRADVVHRQLVGAGVAATLKQEDADGWVVRFGPVSRDDMLVVLNGYVW